MKFRHFLLILSLILILCVILCGGFTADVFAQNFTQWSLPVGAKARIGKGAVPYLRYSPDGKYLAVPTLAGTVWVYETETYQPVSVLGGHAGQIRWVIFSSNSKLLLSVGGEGFVNLWNTETWQLLHSFRAPDTSYGWDASLSFDAKNVIIRNGRDKSIDVWDVETGTHIENIPIEDQPPSEPISWPSFLDNVEEGTYKGYRLWRKVPNNDIIVVWESSATFGGATTFYLYNVTTGEHLRKVKCCIANNILSRFHDIVIHPDGKILAINAYDGRIYFYDIHADAFLNTTIDGHWSLVQRIALSPDGQKLVTEGYVVGLWDVDTQTHLTELFPNGSGWRAGGVVFSPDGELLALGGGGVVSFIDVNTHQTVRTIGDLRHSNRYARNVKFSADMKIFAAAYGNGVIQLWDTKTDTLLHTLIGHDPSILGNGRVSDMEFSPDNKMLASGGHDGKVRLWGVETGEQLQVLTGHPHYVFSVAFSPNGRILVSGGKKGQLRLWDPKSGTLLQTIVSERLLIFDRETPSHLLTLLTEYIGSVDSLTFTPDGRVLVSADRYSGQVDFWNYKTYKHLGTLDAHILIDDVAFSVDGNTLATLGDSTVLLWDYEALNITNEVTEPDADVNDDGVVNILDLVVVANAFGEPEPDADVNGDGVVNVLDLVIIANAI